MGALNFLLPAGLPAEARRELARAQVLGLPDYMPWPTTVRLSDDRLTAWRTVEESGTLAVPWPVGGRWLMVSTATLMEREEPYQLQVELARGKVNQVRSQAADWQMIGLQLSPELAEELRQLSLTFARTACVPEQSTALAAQALERAVQAGDQLVLTYIDQMIQARLQRLGRLETTWSCGLTGPPPGLEETVFFRQAFNAVRIPFSWPEVEPTESAYNWEPIDARVRWAKENGLAIVAGPLVDFSRSQLPEWLWLWERDPQSIAAFMTDYVATAVQRYRSDIPVWHLTAAGNWGSVLSLEEDDVLQLTAQLLLTARQIDAGLELVVGITQPWGDYLATEDRAYSPFALADSLIRHDLPLSSLDLELVPGVQPRGSPEHDLLDTSRLLDTYAALDRPLRVTLGCPSAADRDPRADPDLHIHAPGQTPWTPEGQADWAARFAALALCKPYVQAVNWCHFSDANPHQFPHCGLLDAANIPKPALDRLRVLREQYLQ